MIQSKKQMTGITQKNQDKKDSLTQRENFRKIFLNKNIYDLNSSNVASKYNTLKNSRK